MESQSHCCETSASDAGIKCSSEYTPCVETGDGVLVLFVGGKGQ